MLSLPAPSTTIWQQTSGSSVLVQHAVGEALLPGGISPVAATAIVTGGIAAGAADAAPTAGDVFASGAVPSSVCPVARATHAATKSSMVCRTAVTRAHVPRFIIGGFLVGGHRASSGNKSSWK